MKRLILMRHAKSGWGDPEQRDHDRPLNERGRHAAGLIGSWLKQHGYRPDQALVSNARRTQETWSGVVAASWSAPTSYVAELYHAPPEIMMRCLRAAPDIGVLLILAHQPGIGAFARRVLAEPPTDADFAKYPTCATAIIDLQHNNWSDVDWHSGRLADFVVPRSLE